MGDSTAKSDSVKAWEKAHPIRFQA